MLFSVDNANKVTFSAKLENKSQKKEFPGLNFAMKKFQNLDRHAQTERVDTSLASLHQNAVTSLRLHTGTVGKVTKFSSSAVDGLFVIWDVKK